MELFEWRSESSGNLAFVGSGAESCQPVPCEIISLSDAHYGTIPTSSFVCNQSALVTCNVSCCTHTTNWQTKSYSVFCVSSDTLPDLDAVPHASSFEGTSFGEICTMTCNEEFTLTGLGEEVNPQTLQCAASGHFASWKECERVKCVIPARIVSDAVDSCTDCRVYFGGKLPYSRSLGHTLDGSPQGSKAFTASGDIQGRYENLHYYTAIVCQKSKRRRRNAALYSGQFPLAEYGELVSFKCLSGSSWLDCSL